MKQKVDELVFDLAQDGHNWLPWMPNKLSSSSDTANENFNKPSLEADETADGMRFGDPPKLTEYLPQPSGPNQIGLPEVLFIFNVFLESG